MTQIITLLLASAALFGQPVFEAASIKPADPQARGFSWNSPPGRVSGTNLTLKQLIMIAYDVKQYQIEGGPRWLGSEHYDIVAKMEDAGGKRPNNKEREAQTQAAMQTLLAERFHLAIHRETKTMPAYALVVAKGGFKLQEVEANGGRSTSSSRGKITATRISMERLASFLATQMDRPVADMTGIKGVFNLTIEWSPDENRSNTSPDQPTGPSIFTALQEQLGLKLEAKKAPVEIIVIDGAEKPTEN